RFEAELAELAPGERTAFLESAGLAEPGLTRLIRAGYRLLGLETFFTIGDNEVRAWTFRSGATAYEAAGEIHTDFQRGFIKAETIAQLVGPCGIVDFRPQLIFECSKRRAIVPREVP
ncbi:MAG: DUF933 domain-containing protein, partial [Proteobacteria bacterium]|nr:DUF933 domain-containing protein [Pseudomonadota bacterium]